MGRQGLRLGRGDRRDRPARPEATAPKGRAPNDRSTPEKILLGPGATAAEKPAAIHHRISGVDADQVAKVKHRGGRGRTGGAVGPDALLLLLGIVGINVVSAGEFAGEMGPIGHYTKGRAITGRAGLFPSRHQSDQVDHRDGALIRGQPRRDPPSSRSRTT